MDSWKKTFAVIWAGQLFSTLSSAVVGYAVVFWLSIKTGSAEVLAFSFIATFLPHLLLGPFTGVLVDRWDRKRIMIAADVFIALCTAAMAALFALGVMSLLWMAIVAAVIFAEKVLPNGVRISRFVAPALVALGVWVAVSPSSVPGLTEPDDPAPSMRMEMR